MMQGIAAEARRTRSEARRGATVLRPLRLQRRRAQPATAMWCSGLPARPGWRNVSYPLNACPLLMHVNQFAPAPCEGWQVAATVSLGARPGLPATLEARILEGPLGTALSWESQAGLLSL